MSSCKGLKCREPRNRIYALPAVATDAGLRHIRIDYPSSISELKTQVVQSYRAFDNPIDIQEELQIYNPLNEISVEFPAEDLHYLVYADLDAERPLLKGGLERWR